MFYHLRIYREVYEHLLARYWDYPSSYSVSDFWDMLGLNNSLHTSLVSAVVAPGGPGVGRRGDLLLLLVLGVGVTTSLPMGTDLSHLLLHPLGVLA